MNDIVLALTYFIVFLFSTTLHEAAHAWVALKGGDETAYRGGQVSLDPRPHIRREPIGMVVLPLISALATGFPMGFASAPFDPSWAERYPRRAAIMALAGPVANFLLVLAAALLLRIGQMAGVFYPPSSVSFGAIAASTAGPTWDAIGRVLSIFFSSNLLLAAFNLLPFVPLDGSSVITLFMSAKTTTKYQHFVWSTPMLAWLGLFASWKLVEVLFQPIFIAAVNLVYSGARYGG